MAAFLLAILGGFTSAAAQPLSGTYNVPGDYASLAAAVTDLNARGVAAGGVVINLIAGNPQTAPAGGYVVGGSGSLVLTSTSSTSPVTIQGNGNTVTAYTPQASGTLTDALFKLVGADWITITGFTLQENPANTTTTAASNNMTEWGVALLHVSTTDGAQNNTIQGNTISLNRSYTNTWGVYANNRHSATAIATAEDVTNATTGPNSNNKVYGNTISNVNMGIAFIGTSTAANQDVGNDIGGSSALTGNVISNWGGAAAASSYISNSGTSYGIFMNHQTADNVSYNTLTSATVSGTSVTFRGIFKDYTATAPTGSFVSNITNNTVTMTSGFTSGTFEAIRSQGMTALSGATINLTNNTILNCAVTGAASSSAIVGIVNSSAPGTLNLNGNVVRGTTSTATSGGFTGVSNTGAAVTAININNNQIGNAGGGAVTFSAATSGAVTCLTNSGGAATAALSMTGNDIRGITHTVAATSSHTYVINSAATLSQNISNNTFTNLNVNTTGSVTFLSDSVTAPTGGSKTVSGNSIVTAFNKGGAGGTVTLYADNGSSVTGVTVNNSNNTFSNITVTGATTIAGWSNTDGGQPTKTIQNNVFTGWTGGSSAITAMNVNFGTSSTTTVTGNTVGAITGGGAITGIVLGSSIGTLNASGNTVYGLASTGASAVQGLTSASTTAVIAKNKVYDLSASNAAPTGVYGLLVSAGTTVTLANNLIGDLRAPAASSTTDLVRGINLTSATSTSNLNLYYNTVYLNATSSGANFSTTGLYHTTSTTATTAALNLRDNIIVNLSTPNGTGVAAAYRRSSTTLTNYGSGSNNNLFHAGTPAANKVVFYDGTNADQTLGAFQTRVSPRESASITENPPFLSTTGSSPSFLHINPAVPTQVESGGQVIAGYTDDFDGDARSASTPDLGADEGGFTLADLSGPVIAYTPLGNTATTGSRTLTATITDATGVPTSGLGLPVAYWRINAGAWTAATATWVSGSQYQFTLGAGAVYPDVVSYYIVAQDVVATPNLSSSPGGAGGFTANPPSAATPPGTPSSYAILGSIAGTFKVGVGGDYTTLTAAVTDLNAKVVTGPVTFLLTDASYGAETYPITINANGGLSAANPLVIRPDTGVTAAISGSSATALLVLNGADYVTVDGSNAGTSSRDLTLTNTNTGTTSAVLWAQTTSGADPVTYGTFKNLNVVGNASTTTLFAVGFGSSTISTTSLGTGNSFNTVQNCNLSKAQYGIYSQGASAANKNTGNVFTQNLMNTASPNNIGRGGIWLGFENNVQVTQNAISGVSYASSTDVFGITLGLTAISTTGFTGNEVTNATVARNSIGSVVQSGTYSAAGIAVASAASGTTLIANNLVSGVGANGTSGDFGAGIFLGGGAGSTTQVYYNTVSMSGTSLTGGSQSNIALAIGGSTPVVDVKNNVLSNTQTTGTGNSYAIGLAYSSTVGNYANLTSTNNDLYVGAGATFFTGVTGGLVGTSRATLAAWNAETGRDVPGVSVAALPPFITPSDLHLTPGATSLLESGGTPIAAVTNDYDNDPRNATTPDIGADEWAGALFVANDVAATAFIDPANGGSKSLGVAFSPSASFTNIGTAAQTNVTVRYRIVGPSPAVTEVYNETSVIASLAAAAVTTVTFPSVTLGTGGSYAIYATAELAGDQAPGNDQITGAMSVLAPMAGTYLVGVTAFNELAGTSLTFEPVVRKVTREVLVPEDQQPQMSGDKTSDDVFMADRLTWKTVTTEVEETEWVPMANGQKFDRPLRVSKAEDPSLPEWAMAGAYATITAAVADLNVRGLSGPVTFLLTDATYPTETFPIVVNVTAAPPTATNTVTIKPNSGVVSSVSGASASASLFKVYNTNYVTIDGSNSVGGSSRDLTLENTSSTSPNVVWFGSSGTTTLTGGALKNCVVRNGANTSSAIVISDGATAGNAGYFSNLEVSNNQIEKAYIGVYANGGTTPANGANLTLSGNQLDTAGANAIRLCGLYAQGVNGVTVSGNTIGNFENASAENDMGIWLATGATNAVVSGNAISNLGYTGTSSYAPIGIDVTPGAALANVNVTGNSVTGLSTSGSAAVRGIASPIAATADVVIQRNTVRGVTNNNTSTYGAYGIDVTAGNSHVVKNNFVSDVKFNMTGGAAFSTTYGVFGIRVGSGANLVVAGNTVSLTGALPGTTATSLLSAALAVVGTTSTGCDVRDNLLVNTITGGSTSIAHVSLYLPSAGTSAMELNLNNNAYYCGTTAASQGIAQVGSTAGSGFYLPGNFDPANVTPAANLRAYTSTLSAAANDDNASLATTSAAPFVSASDLHVRTDMLSPVSNAGATVAGLTDDIDGDLRAATPDIGADEFTVYTLNVATVGSGSVAVDPVQTAYPAGATVTLTATPADACQQFMGWSGDATGTANPLTVVMDGNKNITATFATKTYTITASAGAGGAISPSGDVTVACSADQAFTITPESCFDVADVLVDGVSVGAVTSYTFTGVAADHTIAASFVQKTYTIAASAGLGGSISPSGNVVVACGADQAFTITPDACYDIADVLVDGVSVGVVGSYSFTGVNAGHTIAASFALKSYTITASAGAGGSISPSGAVVVGCGADQTFLVSADSGNYIADVLVDGVSVGAVSSYTFPGVAANHTIEASFAVSSFVIAASAGAGGAISPSGNVAVAFGADQTFAITPDGCYDVADVLVDGASVGAVLSYTFTGVSANHTIEALFALKSYTITASAGLGGTISPSGAVTVACGADQTFTIVANVGQSISDVLVDGVSVGAVGSYTFTGVSAGHTIEASFSTVVFTIAASAGAGGSISPAGSVVVAFGTDRTFAVTPDGCYDIVDVLVDGVSVGAVPSYTFTGVSANHTIEALFALRSYTITATAGVGGTISPSGSVAVACGADQAFTIAPDVCYDIADVLVDGVSVGVVNSYTFTGVSAGHTIAASFALRTFTITASAGAGGTISPSGAVVVGCGGSEAFTITANVGQSIADVLVDGVSVGAVGSYTFTSVSADHTIEALFSTVYFNIAASAGAGGSISPAGSVAVAYGADQTFAITPDGCYGVLDVLVDGVSVGAVTTYTFTGVTANHTIAATFALQSFTITASAGAGGAIAPNGAVVVGCGSDQTFTITPNPGLGVLDVLVDGVSVGAVTTYTFTGVGANHTIEATFVDTLCPEVTVTAPNGGEQLVIGVAVDLTWTASDNTGVTCVDLLLSRSGIAGPYETLATCVPNTGTYAWMVAGAMTEHAILKVVAHDAAGNACDDVSDGEFQILEEGVATLLSRFEATPANQGVEVRWQLSGALAFERTSVERSDEQYGQYVKLEQDVAQIDGDNVLVDDTTAVGQTYWYRLSGVTRGGQTITFEPVSTKAGVPVVEFGLKIAGANPTHDVSRIAFAVPRPSHVRVTVVDLQGRRVATLADGVYNPGRYEAIWDGMGDRGRMASGMYMIRLEAPGANLIQRVTFVH